MTSRCMEAEFASRGDRVSVQFSESGHEFHRIRRLLAYLSKFAENKIRLWLFSLMPAPLEAPRVSFAGNKSENITYRIWPWSKSRGHSMKGFE